MSSIRIVAMQDEDVQKALQQETANFGRIFEIRRCSKVAPCNVHSTPGDRNDKHGSIKWSKKRYFVCRGLCVWSEQDEKWLPCKQ